MTGEKKKEIKGPSMTEGQDLVADELMRAPEIIAELRETCKKMVVETREVVKEMERLRSDNISLVRNLERADRTIVVLRRQVDIANETVEELKKKKQPHDPRWKSSRCSKCRKDIIWGYTPRGRRVCVTNESIRIMKQDKENYEAAKRAGEDVVKGFDKHGEYLMGIAVPQGDEYDAQIFLYHFTPEECKRL